MSRFISSCWIAPPPGWIVAMLLAVSSCSGQQTSQGVDARQRTINAWLLCDECDRGERDSVVALGNNAVRALDSVLRQIPAQWLTNLRLQYGATARRAGVRDSAAYVARYLANFTATVQSRAAHALGEIRTPEAIRALEEALAGSATRGYRSDVIRNLEEARRLATTRALSGTFTPSLAKFLDTIWVRRQGGTPWDGDERVVLNGAPFPDDVTVGFRDNGVELGFVAAALPGTYAFSVEGIGSGNSVEGASVSVGLFPERPNVGVRDLTAGPFPVTILRSISMASQAGSVHQYRFRPASALSVNVAADWTGSPVINLAWEDCSDRGDDVAVPQRIRGQVLSAAGAPIAGARVILEGTSVASLTDAAGQFQISGVPRGWSGVVRTTATGYAAQRTETREGAGNLEIVLGAAAAPGVSRQARSPSPNPLRDSVAAGGCRLLSVVRTDTTQEPAIVRLKITSP